jgi:cysteine-rich repeat protein
MTVAVRTVIALLASLGVAALAEAQSQGPNSPASVVNDGSFGSVAWALPAQAATSNNLYAGVTPLGTPSQYLRASGFGFAVPVGAVIDGIEVDVERVSSGGTIFDARARIVKGGVIGATDRSIAGTWATMDTVVTYGSTADLWGETWTAADINSPAFGFVISVSDGVDAAGVDAISITVFYSLCGDSQIGLSEDCDDGNAANGDCCSSTCQFESNGSPCPDADLCNGDETCDGAGDCTPGPVLDCDDSNDCTQDSCDALDGCINATEPHVGCLTALKGTLIYKDNTNNTKDKLVWKWVKGAATTLDDFGVPSGTTSYTLCLYAGTSQALGGATVPGGAATWSPISTKGFKFKDKNGANDGITKVLLKSGAANKSKAIAKGKGDNLPDLPATPFDLPVTVQLVNNENVCFEGVFSTFKLNDAGKFNAKFP